MKPAVYLDEDVSIKLQPLLIGLGYDCLTTREAGRLAATDEEQLEFATSQQRVLLTHNRDDYLLLAEGWRQAQRVHAGILVMLRRKQLAELVAKVDQALAKHERDGWMGLLLFA